jgi:signal transduction histidine kinase
MVVTALILGLSGYLAVRLVFDQVTTAADRALTVRSAFLENQLVLSYRGVVVPFRNDFNPGSFGRSRIVPLAQLLSGSDKVLATFGGAPRRALVAGPFKGLRVGSTIFRTVTVSSVVYQVLIARSSIDLATVVVIARPIGNELDLVDHLRDILLVIWAFSVGLSGVGSYVLARRTLAPVERLRRRAAEADISVDPISLPVPETKDEIEALGRTMNSLLERLQGALAEQQRFLSNAGHELRTPLAALKLELELALKSNRSETELRKSASEALSTTETLVDLVERLFTLSLLDEQRPSFTFGDVDLTSICKDALALHGDQASRRQVALLFEGPFEQHIDGDRAYLTMAVSTLIDNALRYSQTDSSVIVEVKPEGEAQVFVSVTNDGPGFPAEYLPLAFDRFARPDAARGRNDGGAGLGLSLVKSIAEAHHGGAEIYAPGPGLTTVRFALRTRCVRR